MHDENEYDLNFGGIYFKDADEFYKNEAPGIEIPNVRQRAADLGKLINPSANPPPPPPLPPPSMRNNIPSNPMPKSPINVSPNIFTSPTSYDRQQMENMRKERDEAVKREIEAKNLEHQRWKELEYERQRNKTSAQNTDNIIYTRFYNYGLDLIPSYYTYLERKKAEELLSNLIRRGLNKLGEEQMENAIKKLIKDTNPDVSKDASKEDTKIKVIVKTVKPKRKSPKRAPSRKPSKKKTSRKIARKTSKKQKKSKRSMRKK